MQAVKHKKILYLFLFIVLVSSIIVYMNLNAGHTVKKNKKTSLNQQLNTPRSMPLGVGVSFHFTGNPSDIMMMKKAGIKIARTDLLWSKIEKNKGQYQYDGYDELTNGLIKSDIKPYYILNYSNRLYEKNFSIVTPEGQKAFINYVEDVTSRYKDKGVIWEIWNEPNILKYWDTRPNYKDYALLVEKSSKVIKKNDPSGTVVAPALAGLNEESLSWLEEVIKRGLLKDIDAISVHPYRASSPETVIHDYSQLRKLLKKYNYSQLPVIAGEWGYPSNAQWYNIKLSRKQQAQYLVRTYLVNELQGIPISIWYDWKNDGENLLEPEHNYGIREYDVSNSKEAYTALRTMTKTLSGYVFTKRVNVGSSNDYVLEFSNKKNKKIIVYWTTNTNHYIKVSQKGKGKIIFMYGDYIGNFNLYKNPILEVTESPRYLIFE